MGPISTPPTPIAYRERDRRPVGHVEKGVEILRTGQVYWAATYAEAIKLAEANGHRL